MMARAPKKPNEVETLTHDEAKRLNTLTEVTSLQERIETVSNEADLEQVYNTERHLLCIACTRARAIRR